MLLDEIEKTYFKSNTEQSVTNVINFWNENNYFKLKKWPETSESQTQFVQATSKRHSPHSSAKSVCNASVCNRTITKKSKTVYSIEPKRFSSNVQKHHSKMKSPSSDTIIFFVSKISVSCQDILHKCRSQTTTNNRTKLFQMTEYSYFCIYFTA